ncbi:hypothetical protein DIPPA_55552 [Diplonema papillatum]|nr:hypothetical protein DIPPA_55552 [Diplonema papillatum]
MSARAKRSLQEVHVNTPTKRVKQDKPARVSSIPRPRTSSTGRAPSSVPQTPNATPLPPRRFSTTFKTFADKSYTEGIHKTRCPCIAIKELQREIKNLDPRADAKKIASLQDKIVELQKQGCSHAVAKTLTKQEMMENVAKVEGKTLHGKTKQMKDLSASQHDERRQIYEEEEQEREVVVNLCSESVALVEDMFARRIHFCALETSARALLWNDTAGKSFEQEAWCALLTYKLQAVEAEESRVRRETVGESELKKRSWLSNIGRISFQLALCTNSETSERAVLACEEVYVWQLATVRFLKAGSKLLQIAETSVRGAIVRGETKAYENCRNVARLDWPRAELALEEASRRRELLADQYYESDDLFCAASGGRINVIERQEARNRVEVLSEEDATSRFIFTRFELDLPLASLIGRERKAREQNSSHSLALLMEIGHAMLADLPSVTQAAEESARMTVSSFEFDTRRRLQREFDHKCRVTLLTADEMKGRAVLYRQYYQAFVATKSCMFRNEREILASVAVCKAEVVLAAAQEELTVLYRDFLFEGAVLRIEAARRQAYSTVLTEEASQFGDLWREMRRHSRFLIEDAEHGARCAVVFDEGVCLRALLSESAKNGGHAALLSHERSCRGRFHAEAHQATEALMIFDEEGRRSVILNEEGFGFIAFNNDFVTTGGMVFVSCCEKLNRRDVLQEEVFDRETIVKLTETGARRVAENSEEICRRRIVGAYIQSVGLALFQQQESSSRTEVETDETDGTRLIRDAHVEACKLLFACRDDFVAAKQYFNGKEMIYNLPLWPVDSGSELACAANENMMSLLRHSAVLMDATEANWRNAVEKKSAEIGKLHSEASHAKAQTSRARDDLRDLEAVYRTESSQFTKLKAGHKALRERHEQLEKNSRNTTGANEVARLQKRIKDLETDLAASQNALDKERRRATGKGKRTL